MRRLDLTEPELQELINLMDQGVKYQGLASVKNAAYLLSKIQAAPVVDFEHDTTEVPPKPKK